MGHQASKENTDNESQSAIPPRAAFDHQLKEQVAPKFQAGISNFPPTVSKIDAYTYHLLIILNTTASCNSNWITKNSGYS
jgi:hypothetical protein